MLKPSSLIGMPIIIIIDGILRHDDPDLDE
jgi:hypothetical protein